MQLLSRQMRRAGALLAFAACLSCGSGRRFVAPVDDYSLYRATRVSSSFEQRLQAGWRYLEQHPDGAWRREVSAWFEHADTTYFKAAHNSVTKLERYLKILPDGPHAAAAADRLSELRTSAEYRRAGERRLMEEAQQIEQSLASAAQLRRQLLETFRGWVIRLVRIDSWGGRTHELDHEFINAYRLTAPEASCGPDRCVKTLSLFYAIPEARSLGQRQTVFDIALDLHNGGVVRGEIVGPELFSRLSEAIELAPVGPDAMHARTEALGRVAELVALIVEAELPEQSCARAAISPVVLERSCNGIWIRMIAAIGADQEDRIVVEPAVADGPSASGGSNP